MARPPWLSSLSQGFKAHRLGRTGWYLELHRDRLRVASTELPPRPGEPLDAPTTRRSITLDAAPGPLTAAAALAEACALFDAVLAGTWRWPDPDAAPAPGEPGRLAPAVLERLTERLRTALVGEQMSPGTWQRTWVPYLRHLAATAAAAGAVTDAELLASYLRHWQPNSRSRQMAYDRARRLWREASWDWPDAVATLRGNGKAAASPDGVRAFTDAELQELRARIERSRLTAADLVAWDCVIVFGLRPAELQGLVLRTVNGTPTATVTRQKRSSRGRSGARTIPAVPPAGWPADCFELVERWERHGLPAGMVAHRSPGEVMGQQLNRLQRQRPVRIPLDAELTAYSCRHALALRLGLELGLHVREAAALMGHSPAVHLSTYGRRLDSPTLVEKVRRLTAGRSAQ